MNVLNHSGMLTAVTTAADATAREHVIVVVKGTFAIPDDGGAAELASLEAQAPLVFADTFSGAPGCSAPIFEGEFALRKPRCDILINAVAYAPEGRPAERCTVGVKVGNWQKSFDVVGDRVWCRRGLFLGPSAPTPFLSLPLTYDRAYGGIDDTDDAHTVAYSCNPVGRGFGLERSGGRLFGRPVANTEESHRPVVVPWGNYRPMGFGPIHRSWQPRLALAGTYDQNWIDHVFPFPPKDFDDHHNQAAPDDQQVAELAAGAEVILVNMTPSGYIGFRLPADLEMPVVFFPRVGEPELAYANLDTVLILPELRQLQFLWRCARPVRRDIFELSQILVGHASRAWWRARRTGKTYYPGLNTLMRDGSESPRGRP